MEKASPTHVVNPPSALSRAPSPPSPVLPNTEPLPATVPTQAGPHPTLISLNTELTPHFLPAAALDSLAVRRNRALGLKLLAGLVIGGLIIYLGGGALNGWQTDALIKERKARRAHGEGESWVLPKRWLEHDAGELIIGNREVLHECQRVLLFEFTGLVEL